ncbi:MAG: helix-turn-helix domain-containing protein [Cellulosilyticum sp.]|nr:helix-turn-helix domain-containing protein [Cellulosilyticum sp.]
MDCTKVGELIRSRRIEKELTQKQLADAMNISDKTISKWERGLGCPDVSLLPELAHLLGINIEEILKGDLKMSELVNGNMKKTQFYVCQKCGNIITSTGEANLSCCGHKLEALIREKVDENHKLQVETIEDEWYVTTDHEMTKNHHIAFIALVTGERVLLVKQYPEWGIHLRLPKFGHGYLYSYCTEHGLSYQII